ncbi:hypothetical protein [Dyella terrae]|uniref:hypothetical protein n=1 Tax=Dyella terrae TaxID=522259 RepID=UPI001EFEB41C|nr:hypothetical protein [Dyella terrae]ULU25724.1 hypothetical protein DYST_02659 [Dyella terrae]
MLKLRRLSMLNVLIAMMSVTVIAAVTLLLWHGFGPRQHIAAAMKDADALKDVVLEAATVHGGLAGIHSTDLHYDSAASIGTYIAYAEIADGGLITLHTRNTGASPDPILMLIPTERNGKKGAEITWTCKLVLNSYSLSPPDCLNQETILVRSAPTPAAQTPRANSASSSALAHNATRP